jgi:hypothetical protein
VKDRAPPPFGDSRDLRQDVGDPDREDHAPAQVLIGARAHGEAAVDRPDLGAGRLPRRDRGVRQHLGSPPGRYRRRRLAIVPEKPVRRAGEAVAPLTCIQDEHAAARPAQLQRRREPRVASSDDDDVMHGPSIPF